MFGMIRINYTGRHDFNFLAKMLISSIILLR